MRQTTSTPKRAQAALLMPDAAILVSVTTEAPLFSAARASFTASLEKRIFSAKSKSAVVCITRFTTGSSSGAPSQAPISEAMILMLACSISSGLIAVTSSLKFFVKKDCSIKYPVSGSRRVYFACRETDVCRPMSAPCERLQNNSGRAASAIDSTANPAVVVKFQNKSCLAISLLKRPK